jgi:Fe-S cluster assembly protein SufD
MRGNMDQNSLISFKDSNREKLFNALDSCSQNYSDDRFESIIEFLEQYDTHAVQGAALELKDENEMTLAGRFLWNDGIKGNVLNETAEARGIIFNTLDQIKRESPDIYEKLSDWQSIHQKDGSGRMLSALSKETIVLYIPKYVSASKEFLLDLILSKEGKGAAVQIWVFLEKGAQAVFTLNLRSRDSEADNFFTGLLNVFVGEGAHLILNEVQDFHQKMFSYTRKSVVVAKDGDLQWNICELGSEKSKSYSDLILSGKGSNAVVNGLYFPNRNQTFSILTRQAHMESNTTSNLYFKGAVSDDARANWEGMIYVDPIAEKSDGYQKNENLMLSPNAHAASKPGLEILTDDVRCSHGTTITEIDPNQIFYLMSRGIPETDAKRLVIQGFFDTVLHKISYEPIRTKLQEKIYRKMD